MTVGLVVVSHSPKLVEGLVEMLEQIVQGGVRVAGVGGAEDGGLGTDAFAIQAAVEAVLEGSEAALLLMDLGSAVMAAEVALESLAEDLRARVRMADAPIVEGAVAAAVEASVGAGLEAVTQAAETSRQQTKLLA